MVTFWVIGGIGVALLVALLLVGDVLESLHHFEALSGEYFSMASLSGFLGAFGFTGAGALAASGSVTIATVAGCLVGAFFGWLAAWGTRQLKAGESASAMNTRSLVGASGTVISDIAADGYGEVRIHAAGQPLKINARAEMALASGTRVWVSDVLSATAVQVEPSDVLDDVGGQPGTTPGTNL